MNFYETDYEEVKEALMLRIDEFDEEFWQEQAIENIPADWEVRIRPTIPVGLNTKLRFALDVYVIRDDDTEYAYELVKKMIKEYFRYSTIKPRIRVKQ